MSLAVISKGKPSSAASKSILSHAPTRVPATVTL